MKELITNLEGKTIAGVVEAGAYDSICLHFTTGEAALIEIYREDEDRGDLVVRGTADGLMPHELRDLGLIPREEFDAVREAEKNQRLTRAEQVERAQLERLLKKYGG